MRCQKHHTMATNKYHQILRRILDSGKRQSNRKGNIVYLINEQLSLTPADLLDIFEGHGIARKKLRSELKLFMSGERSVEKYREAGINSPFSPGCQAEYLSMQLTISFLSGSSSLMTDSACRG